MVQPDVVVWKAGARRYRVMHQLGLSFWAYSSFRQSAVSPSMMRPFTNPASFYSLQLLSTGAELARNYLAVRIKEFAHAVANGSCPFKILWLNT